MRKHVLLLLTNNFTLQDIAAIEARNNRLERQARHNAALMVSLERLLDRLVLPEQTERILTTSTFNYGMCVPSPPQCTPRMIIACQSTMHRGTGLEGCIMGATDVKQR